MKRALSCLLILLLFFSTAHAAGSYVVATPGGWLNMRKEPEEKAVIKEFIPNGDDVSLVEFVDADWAKINWKGIVGFVKRDFIMTIDEALKADYPDSVTVYPDVTQVYAREKPDAESKILAVQNQADEIIVLEEKDGWCYVSLSKAYGENIFAWIPASDVESRRTKPMSDSEIYQQTPILLGQMLSDTAAYALPDKTSKKLPTLEKGSEVLVHGYQDIWCYVTSGEKGGWILASQVHLTGRQLAQDSVVYEDFSAAYYTGYTAEEVLLYPEPTSRLEEGRKKTAPEGGWYVLKRAMDSHGTTWTLLWDGEGTSGWTPSENVQFSQELSYFDYENPVSSMDTGTAYVKAGGAKLYSRLSSASPVQCEIPGGTELEISLRKGGAGTQYNGMSGFVMYDDIEVGFIIMPGWSELEKTTPPEDESAYITRENAREKADQALKRAYPDFDAEKLTVNMDRVRQGENAVCYDLAYFMDETYLYAATVDAFTGEVTFLANYTAFASAYATPAPTKKPAAQSSGKQEDEKMSWSRAQKIADMALDAEYSDFDAALYPNVQTKERRTAPGLDFEGMFYQFDYYTQDGSGYACCILDARSGVVVYTSNQINHDLTELDDATPAPTQTPPPQDAETIGESRARSIADSALSSKYPAFSGATFSKVRVWYNEKDTGFGPYAYHVEYYDEFGDCVYNCVMDAFTGEVKYTYGGIPGEINGAVEQPFRIASVG